MKVEVPHLRGYFAIRAPPPLPIQGGGGTVSHRFRRLCPAHRPSMCYTINPYAMLFSRRIPIVLRLLALCTQFALRCAPPCLLYASNLTSYTCLSCRPALNSAPALSLFSILISAPSRPCCSVLKLPPTLPSAPYFYSLSRYPSRPLLAPVLPSTMACPCSPFPMPFPPSGPLYLLLSDLPVAMF